MKIDQKLDPSAVSISSADRAEADARTRGTTSTPGRTGDAVSVSTDAQLLHRALKAATEEPAVRADKVEAARRKLAAGELGRDVNAIADGIIDELLER